MEKTKEKTRYLTGMAILSALIIVLQIVCSFIKFGPVSITLALVPIIVGAAIYKGKAGALLGFVLGIVVFLSGVFGWDGGFVMYLMSLNPVPCVAVVLLKSTVAGFLAQKTYQWIAPKAEKTAVVLAGIVCPVVNTGIFIASMFLFFYPALEGLAQNAGTNVVAFALTGLVGINFVIELVVNLVLASTITYIITATKKHKASV